MFCEQIATELDIIASHDPCHGRAGFMDSQSNLPLYPVSMSSFATWARRSEDKIRETIRTKHSVIFANKLAHGRGKRAATPTDGENMV